MRQGFAEVIPQAPTHKAADRQRIPSDETPRFLHRGLIARVLAQRVEQRFDSATPGGPTMAQGRASYQDHATGPQSLDQDL